MEEKDGTIRFGEKEVRPDVAVAEILKVALERGACIFNNRKDVSTLFKLWVLRYVDQFPFSKHLRGLYPLQSSCKFGIMRLILLASTNLRFGIFEGRHRCCALGNVMTGHRSFQNSVMEGGVRPIHRSRTTMSCFKEKRVLFEHMNMLNRKVLCIPNKEGFGNCLTMSKAKSEKTDTALSMKLDVSLAQM